MGLTSTGCHCHGREPAPFLARGWHLGATLPSWQVAVRMSFPRFEAGLAEVPAPTMCSRRAAHCGRRVFSTRRFLLRPQGLALSARAFISKPRCSQIDLRRPRTDAATGEPSGRAAWRRAAHSAPTTPLHFIHDDWSWLGGVKQAPSKCISQLQQRQQLCKGCKLAATAVVQKLQSSRNKQPQQQMQWQQWCLGSTIRWQAAASVGRPHSLERHWL